MKKRVLRSVLLLSLLVSVSILQGCSDVTAKTVTTPQKVAVKTAKVIRDGRVVPVKATGKVETVVESHLAFATGGYIKNFYYSEGEFVKKGTKIAELNLSEINSQVKKAKSGYQKAQRDLERVTTLYSDSVVTKEVFENAGTAFEIAKSDLNIANYNLEHSTIYAPVSGKILKQYAERYEIVAPYSPVVKFAGTSSGWIIKSSISDRDIMSISIGDSATLKLDMYRDVLITATVTNISEEADPVTSLFEVELSITSRGKRLKSGFIGNVEIFPAAQDRYTFIPVEAIINANSQTASVYAITPSDSIYSVEITVPRLYKGYAAVSGGLNGVNEVITDGVHYLNNQSQIKRVN